MSTSKNQKVFSAKDLLETHRSPLNPTSLFNGMILAGLLEEKEYLSSTGSGEIKSYLSLTNQGMRFGVNRASEYSQKTDIRFYTCTFKELLVLSSKAILNHSENIE